MVADRDHPRRTCCPPPRISARRWSRSGSAATTGSSSMTIARCAPPRAAGSCCAISARSGSRSSMAASRNGGAKGARSKAARRPAHGPFRRVAAPGGGRQGESSLPQRELPILDARGMPASRAASPTRARGRAPAISPDRATCPMPRSIATMARFKSDAALARSSPRRGSIRRGRSSPPADRASPPTA